MRNLSVIALLLAIFFSSEPVCASDASPGDPSASLAALKDGNARYAKNHSEKPDDDNALRLRLAREGQRPIAAVIACADSRVPVESIFDQSLGGLFVIRAAGNTADIQSIGSVQYAVEHLGVPLVVVLGHTHCGAVHAVIAEEAATGCLRRMLAPIISARAAAGSDSMQLVTESNVKQAIWTLQGNIQGLTERVAGGNLRLIGALYDIETGVVEWME